ncbi:hypothetical protein FQN57_000815 [Myotisia sp. PD_48]|nr:hypothetical protein FQN57_000815 [Myotisia sp. PD_48]
MAVSTFSVSSVAVQPDNFDSHPSSFPLFPDLLSFPEFACPNDPILSATPAIYEDFDSAGLLSLDPSFIPDAPTSPATQLYSSFPSNSHQTTDGVSSSHFSFSNSFDNISAEEACFFPNSEQPLNIAIGDLPLLSSEPQNSYSNVVDLFSRSEEHSTDGSSSSPHSHTSAVNSGYQIPSAVPEPMVSSNSVSSHSSPGTLPNRPPSRKRPLTPSGHSSPSTTMDMAQSTNDPVLEKRQRNTMAARRFRKKKEDRIRNLELQLSQTIKERDDLKLKVARLEGQNVMLRRLTNNEKSN